MNTDDELRDDNLEVGNEIDSDDSQSDSPAAELEDSGQDEPLPLNAGEIAEHIATSELEIEVPLETVIEASKRGHHIIQP